MRENYQKYDFIPNPSLASTLCGQKSVVSPLLLLFRFESYKIHLDHPFACAEP